MILLLDAGNTRIKWALLADGELLNPGEAVHGGDQIGRALQAIPSVPARATAVYASNVAGARARQQIEEVLSDRYGVPVQFASAGASLAGVRNAYREPGRLGVDRWLALVAAYRHHTQPVCVVDAGTAMTVDLVDDRGRHLGGVITPGLGLMRRSLRQTGELGRVAEQPPHDEQGAEFPWPRDPASAMFRGSLYALAGLAERGLAMLRARCGRGTLVLCGGDAAELRQVLTMEVDYRPLLVLEGLAIWQVSRSSGGGLQTVPDG